MADVASILRLLSDLAPSAARPRLDVTDQDFAWIGTDPWPALADWVRTDVPPASTDAGLLLPADPEVAALAQLDALHPEVPVLRLGWVYLVARSTDDPTARRVVLPLAERPLRLGRQSGILLRPAGYRPAYLGPWDLSSLVPDGPDAARLEQDVPFGGGPFALREVSEALLDRMPVLTGWIREVAGAMGHPGVRIVGPDDPRTIGGPGPVAVVGFGVHTAHDVGALDVRSSLAAWSRLAPGRPSAFDAVYLGPPPAPGGAAGGGAVLSPLVLSSAQEEVVRRSATEAVTVVSGPPGTGKSHTAVAVALDAVGRGERVLLATRSAEAADVLAGLLERVPGPDPVLFGGGVRAARLASTLGEGLAQPADAAADARLRSSWERAAVAGRAVDAVLEGIGTWQRYRDVMAEVPAHAAVAPRWFEAAADLGRARARLAEATARAGGWRWRARRALRRAREDAGAGPDVGLDRLTVALDVAATRAAAAGVVPSVAEARWAELDAAEAEVRVAAGRALDAHVRARVGPGHTRAVAALAAALRTGRSQRRRHLRSVDTGWLTHALPLWIGTLGDIEELLPAVPGMFDLVVLDEASQIDQSSAAVALLRGRRAVVVGDPRQLRFVSFVADRDVAAAIDRHGLREVADRLDVRRISAFDLAAGSSPVTFLDEHFRGPPHLVGFSAHRFYGGRLTFATRHPATEQVDCIDVRALDGDRADDGSSPAEVEAVVELLAEVAEVAAAGGAIPSVGVATPFRAQADALLTAVRERWTAEEIGRFRLRVGTVHAFQGDERDLMVLSLGLGPDGSGLRFLEDPNLFNVLVTRARQRILVLTSHTPPGPGLLRDYLRWADAPPPVPAGIEPGPGPAPDPWAAAVAQALRVGGAPIRERYPVGRWTVDLVVGEGPAAVAVELAVHPDGPDAHRRRHLALRRSGWRVVDAFPPATDGDPIAAAVALVALVGVVLDAR
jgi:hypothetical protein